MAGGSYKQQCPSCEAMVLIKDPKMVGKKIDCPQCKYRFVVEKPKGEDAEAEAPAEEPKAKPKGKQPATKKPGDTAAGPAAKKKVGPRKPFGDDDDEAGPPAEKEGSSSKVLVMGIGLSVLAVALLGVGGWFLFFSSTDPTDTRRQSKGVQITKSTETKGPDTVQTGPVDPTNLLPNDTQVVVNFNFKDLLESAVGRAAQAPGAFTLTDLNKKLGLPVSDIDRIVVGSSAKKNWTFIVLRTGKPINIKSVQTALALEPGKGSPIKGQDFFELPPSTLLDALEHAFLEAAPSVKPATQTRSRALAVRLADPQTLVLADPDVMKDFLDAEGKPATKTAKPGGRYLTIEPALKNALDRVEKTPVLVSMAWDTEMSKAQITGAQVALKELKAREDFKEFAPELDKLNTQLGAIRAVGLGVQFKDSTQLPLAIESKDEEGTKTLQNALMAISRKLSVDRALIAAGVNVTVAGGTTIGEKNNPNTKIAIDPQVFGTTWGVNLDIAIPGVGVTQMVEDALRPQMIMLHAMTEMIGGQSRIFALAAALKAYAGKTGNFPRGIVKRDLPSSRNGRPFLPNQGLSWLVELLPSLGYDVIFANLEQKLGWREGRNVEMALVPVADFLDGSKPVNTWWARIKTRTGAEERFAATHYVGVAGVGMDAAELPANSPRAGVFGYDRQTKVSDIKDPASVIAVLQVPPTYPRPWIAGGGATVMGVPLKDSIKPFVCVEHAGKRGAYAIMADGKVRFIPETMADDAFQALCVLNGGAKAAAALKETAEVEAKNTAVLKAKE